MTGTGLRLGVDEVALAVAQSGFEDLARELVMWADGEIVSADAVRARLLAAGHSLLARGLVGVGPGGELTLDSQLGEAATALARSDYSLRASVKRPSGERVRTYHFVGGRIFRHVVVSGLVHEIDALLTATEVEADLLEFFEGPTEAAHDDPKVTMPPEFEMVARTGDPNALDHVRRLESLSPTCRRVIEDLSSATFRGSLIRVDYDGDGRPTSERGALLLRKGPRLWLMPIDTTAANGVVMNAAPATADALSQVIGELTTSES